MRFQTATEKIRNAIAFRANRVTEALHLQHSLQLNGKLFQIPILGDLGAVNVYLKKDWFFQFISALQPASGTHFLDIGVNVGQSLLMFRSRYDNPYWGFEPNPSCVAYVNALIRANRFSNTHIVPVGLSATDALVKLYARSERDSSATIHADLKPGLFDAGSAKFVPVFNYENLKLNIEPIGLVKIDVEGAELDVLSGMQQTLRKQQPTVVCEVLDYTAEESHGQEQRRATNVTDLMKGLGYSIYRILPRPNGSLQYEALQTITLQKWTPESLHRNDYLFLPPHVPAPPQ